MGGSAGSIYVDLLLRDGRYRQSLQQTRNQTRQWAGQVAGDTAGVERAFLGVIDPVDNVKSAISSVGLSVAGALSVSAIVNYSDSWKQMNARLGLVVQDASELAKVQKQLFDIAQRTRQPLESITNLYSRMGQIIPETSKASLDLLGITETVASSLAITGETSLSAQAAIIQFTQALATNFEAAGQEIRSIQEQAPRLAVALARALGDGTDKSLKQLVEDGVVSVEAIGRAFREGQPEFELLRLEMEKIPRTVNQAFTNLNNALLVYVGNSNAATEGTNALALGIDSVAKNLSVILDTALVLSSVLLFRGAASVVDNISGSFLRWNENINRQKNLLSAVSLSSAAYNTEVSRLAASTQFYATATGKSERVAAALAKQQASLLGTSSASVIAVNSLGQATNLAASRFGFLKTAGLGLVNFFGGPWTAGLSAATIALTFFMSRQSEAEKIAAEYGISLDDIREKTDRARLSQEEFNRQFDQKKLKEYSDKIALLNEQMSDLADNITNVTLSQVGFAEKFGLGFSFLSDKLIKLGDDFDDGKITIQQYNAEIDRLETEYPRFDRTFDALRKNISLWEELRGMVTGYKEESANIESGNKRALAAADEFTRLEQADLLVPEEVKKQREETVRSATNAQNDLNNTYRQYESLITGVKQEEIDRNRVLAELSKLVGTQYIPNQDALNAAMMRYDESLKTAKQTTDEWSEFSKQAAKNIQDAFADFLFDPFQDGLDGMLKGFLDTVRKMVAEWAASNLMTAFSEVGKGSGGGGGLFGGIGDLFAGFFADGGAIPPGQFGIVGERGPELAFGGTSGKTIVPNTGGMGGDIINIDARGASPGVGEEIRRVMMEVTTLRKEVPNMAVSAVQNANRRNPRLLNG